MAIITISRGSFNRGKEVAETLAQRLGYACVSRDVLLEASEEFNIPEIKLVRALREPTTALERFQHGRERYVRYIQSALLRHAARDNLVYHGLAGHYFLRDLPHVFKVRVLADMEVRVREEMRRAHLTEEEARRLLKADDEERRKWSLRLYGIDIWDTRLYDIVLRIGRLGVDDAVEILFRMAQKPAFQSTPESRQQVKEMAFAARVRANLAKRYPWVRITTRAGTVYIQQWNRETGGKEEDAIREILRGVDGVRDVVFNLLPEGDPGHSVNPFHKIP